MFVKEKFFHAILYSADAKNKLPHVRELLPEIRNIDLQQDNADCVLSYVGAKASKKAIRSSMENKIPHYKINDGFICSIGYKGESMPYSSISVDKISNSFRDEIDDKLPHLKSILENKEFPEELLSRAKSCIQFIKNNRITRFNDEVNLENSNFELPVGNNILLIDEDVKIVSTNKAIQKRHQKHRQEIFDKMFMSAKEKFPDFNILIKPPPNSFYNQGSSYLKKYYNRVGVYPFLEKINIYSIIPKVNAVLTVSSLDGMEALIGGAVVHCYGSPFYSGWGLTRDYVKKDKRKRALNLEKLFAGAYINYTRYLNPYSKKICEIEEFLSIVNSINKRNTNLIKPLYCLGFTYWKKDFVRKFLKTPKNKIRFCYSERSAVKKAKNNDGEVVIWASKERSKLKNLCDKYSVNLNRVEDGFIRSVGLGSDLTPALSLVFDRKGIYYNANNLSDLEDMLNRFNISNEQIFRAKDLIEHINNNSITKYNFDSSDLKMSFPKDRKIILVPGQVEDDASVTNSKSNVKTNRKLLELTRRKEPDSWIIYKPHPDVVSGNRKGHLPKKVAGRYANAIMEKTSITNLIERCDKVYTISSLVGFEALLKEKEVHTFGTPFYAGWGLTFDIVKFPRRKRNLNIETLAYLALIEYPRYIDPVSKIICEPEMVIERIAVNKTEIKKSEVSSRKLKILKYFKSLIKDIRKSFD